ncbi:MAG: hypothetical protein U0835_20825 [Isosphaeraceae bacterium]
MKPAKASWGGFGRRSAALALIAGAGFVSAAGRAEAGWFWRNNPDDCAPCTRHARAEWGPARCQAQQLADLDCAGLAAYSEHMRWAANQTSLRVYLAVPAAAATASPTPSPAPAETAPEPPATPEASAPATTPEVPSATAPAATPAGTPEGSSGGRR